MAGMVGFCGSRALPASAGVSAALAAGASSRLRVFAAFGPVSPPVSPPSGSGSWASLALAAGLGLPVVVFPVEELTTVGSADVLPAPWGSWAPLASLGSGSAWLGGFRLVPASPALFGC